MKTAVRSSAAFAHQRLRGESKEHNEALGEQRASARRSMRHALPAFVLTTRKGSASTSRSR